MIIETIDALAIFHEIGYTHNDLKYANIMLSSNLDVTLIDFDCAKPYLKRIDSDESTKEHISTGTVEVFAGNIIWSSLNHMQFNVTSRKDDLMSAAYMTLMLLNRNQFPLLDKRYAVPFKTQEEMQA